MQSGQKHSHSQPTSADHQRYWRIPYFVPDLPSAEEVFPFLETLDDTKWYSNFGPLEQSLGQQFADCFFEQAVAENLCFTNSGTMAITLALRALNLDKGSLVLIPALTFPATALAVLNAGLIPVIQQTEPSLELTPKQALAACKQYNIKTVVPVFYHCKLQRSEWDTFIANTGIPVVADACPALGSQSLPEQMILTFSLHATKTYGCGEGGIVLAANQEYIKRVKKLTNFSLDKGVIDGWGDNGKLSEYHASVAHAQLQRVKYIEQRKKTITQYYKNALSGLDKRNRLLTDLESRPSNILIHSSEDSIKYLHKSFNEQFIETRLFHYPDLSKQPFMKTYPIIDSFEEQHLFSGRILSLPFYNRLLEYEVGHICEILHRHIDEIEHTPQPLYKSTA